MYHFDEVGYLEESDFQAAFTMTLSEPPCIFRAGHPFIFFIRDIKSGSVMFMGRLADPTQWALKVPGAREKVACHDDRS